MNALETAYVNERLTPMFASGLILGWSFEPITLKLADQVRYTPDFLLQMPDGTVELHETKACRKGGAYLMEDDAWVKLKIADSIFAWMYRFARAGRLAKSDGGGWRIDYLRPQG